MSETLTPEERLTEAEKDIIENAWIIAPKDGPRDGADDPMYLAVERILAARLADVSARLAKVEALADEWESEGTSLIEHCYDAREVHEGSTMQSLADILRAALHPDPSETP